MGLLRGSSCIASRSHFPSKRGYYNDILEWGKKRSVRRMYKDFYASPNDVPGSTMDIYRDLHRYYGLQHKSFEDALPEIRAEYFARIKATFVMGATLQTAFTVFSILLFVILATQVAAQVSNKTNEEEVESTLNERVESEVEQIISQIQSQSFDQKEIERKWQFIVNELNLGKAENVEKSLEASWTNIQTKDFITGAPLANKTVYPWSFKNADFRESVESRGNILPFPLNYIPPVEFHSTVLNVYNMFQLVADAGSFLIKNIKDLL